MVLHSIVLPIKRKPKAFQFPPLMADAKGRDCGLRQK